MCDGRATWAATLCTGGAQLQSTRHKIHCSSIVLEYDYSIVLGQNGDRARQGEQHRLAQHSAAGKRMSFGVFTTQPTDPAN